MWRRIRNIGGNTAALILAGYVAYAFLRPRQPETQMVQSTPISQTVEPRTTALPSGTPTIEQTLVNQSLRAYNADVMGKLIAEKMNGLPLEEGKLYGVLELIGGVNATELVRLGFKPDENGILAGGIGETLEKFIQAASPTLAIIGDSAVKIGEDLNNLGNQVQDGLYFKGSGTLSVEYDSATNEFTITR